MSMSLTYEPYSEPLHIFCMRRVRLTVEGLEDSAWPLCRNNEPGRILASLGFAPNPIPDTRNPKPKIYTNGGVGGRRAASVRSWCWLIDSWDLSGRGTKRAEDAQGTPTQSHISPIILVYEEKPVVAFRVSGLRLGSRVTYRGTSLIRNTPLLGPQSRTMPRGGPGEGGGFL